MENLVQLSTKYTKSSTYSQQGYQNILHYYNILKVLLEHHKIPSQGLDDFTITKILNDLAMMDSNNFYHNLGVGEREGRIYSDLVRQRHYNLSHGIGRSGDLNEIQPKAAGSSLIYQLTNRLVEHAFKLIGLRDLSNCLIVPMATGMTIALVLNTLKSKHSNENNSKKYVIWSRIDQKSCFKAILFAGLIPIIIDQIFDDKQQLHTNLQGIIEAIECYGRENIIAIISTTSCFAPRQPDQIDEIAKISQQYDIPHVINNAYGLQSPIIVKLINRAMTLGRVDAVIQSTDKNFLVPVGGAIIASKKEELITEVSSMYPGRASSSPIIDLFITLLSMGVDGYTSLLKKRSEHIEMIKKLFESKFNSKFDGKLIPSVRNDISIAITFPYLQQQLKVSRDEEELVQHLNELSVDEPIVEETVITTTVTAALPDAAFIPTNPKYTPTFFGSMLFQREISGCRVVAMTSKVTKINGYEFKNWGSHCSNYEDITGYSAYFTVAAAIGMKDGEVEEFMKRLEKVCDKFIRNRLAV